MKNWFMAKSITVRVALIVLSVAVVAGVGTGIYMIASRNASKETAVVEDKSNTDEVKSPVIAEEEEKKEEEQPVVTEPVVEEVAEVPAAEPVVEEVIEDKGLGYQKNSNKLENGDFSDGMNAWEAYSFVDGNIDYNVDDYFWITMGEAGTEDWHVQLKQAGIRLEKGKWYTITFSAKSDLARNITCAIQRDGMIHNDDWTPYANAKEFSIGKGWKTYSYTFQMNENTDNAAVMMFSMGAIGGRRITSEHTVCIDSVSIKKLADNWMDSLRVGDNLIGNADFARESLLWESSVVAPGAGNVSFTGNKATFDIKNVGTVDWHVQLKQGGIRLEKNTGYRLTFNVSSNVARTIKIGFMDTNYINWYGGGDVVLNGTDNQTVTLDFYNSIGADANALFMVSMGLIDNISTPAGKIAFTNFRLVKCNDVNASAGNGGGSYVSPNHYLSGGWEVYDHESSHTNSVTEDNGVFNISITNTGSEDWHVQLQNKNTSLEQGKYYKISYEIKSTIARNIGATIQRDGAADDDWTPYIDGSNVVEVGTDWELKEKTFQMTHESDSRAIYNFSFGKVAGASVSGTHVISIRNIKIEEVDAPVPQDREINVGDQVLKSDGVIKSADYDKNVNGANATASLDISNGTITVNVENPGVNSWDVQAIQKDLKLEKGATYEVKITASSTVQRVIKVDFLSANNDYYGGNDIPVNPSAQEYSFNFTMNNNTDLTAKMTISFGKISDVDTPASTIKVTAISVVKKSNAPELGDNVGVIPVTEGSQSGEFVLNPADYGITNPMGKDIEFTIKVKSTAGFSGSIGGTTTEGNGWMNHPTGFASSAGEAVSFTYTVEKYNGYAKIDMWYMTTAIEVVEVSMRDVTVTTPPSGEEDQPIAVVDASSEWKYQIVPSAYGVSDPVGKKLKISLTLKSDGAFAGGIGGNVPGSWAQGDFSSDTGAEMVAEYVLDSYVDYAHVQFWTPANPVKIMAISVEVVGGNTDQELAPVATITSTDENKFYQIIPENYGIAEPYGKNLKVTVSFDGNMKYEGAVAGNGLDGNWNADGYFVYEEGGANTYVYTFPGYKDYMKIDFYYIQDEVKIMSVNVEVVE